MRQTNLLVAAGLLAAVFGVALWLTVCGRAQCPVDPDLDGGFALVVYEGDLEVGRVYRDLAGSRYTEHWVLYPNYSFDQITRAGASIEIVADGCTSYKSVDDFLNRVPFPKGSRYVIASCQEFDRLP